MAMGDQKQAIAPYNFVPLPETINYSDEKPSRFDLFYQEPGNERYTGELIIDARNKTPLFIRGPIKKDGDGSWNTSEDTRLRSQPFLDSDGTPIIPGSSFRGMIKTIVEILSYSKLTPVSNEKLFYRDLNSDDYKNAFICEEPSVNGGLLNLNYAPVNQRARVYRSKVRTGFLRSDDSRWVIEECEYARVEHDLIQKNLQQSPFTAAGRAKLPNWEIQNSICYVQADAANTDYFFQQNVRHPVFYLRFKKVRSGLSRIPKNDFEKATLVITGHMPNKHMEFCFLNERTLCVNVKRDKNLIRV
jgi:hypothetical protein